MSLLDRVPEYIRSLVPYEPGKPIEEVEREYGIEGSIKLASNENPLGPSPKAVKAVAERVSDLHLYPDGDSFYLKRALAAKLGVSQDRLIFGNGSNELIELAVRTFMRPGDEAIVAHRAFVIYRLVVQAAGGASKIVPLKDFTHDLEAMAQAITPKTRVVFLANPNNPTGTIYRRREFERFLERISAEILLIVDEAYFEYVGDADYPNSIAYQVYQGEGRTILTLRTFSKLYGLAGLRIGYAVGPKEIVGLMQRVRQPFNVNAAAQWAALAALDDAEHIRRTLEVNREGMEYLEREVDKLGLKRVASQANFILLRVGDGRAVFEKLLRRGVIVRPMGAYDLPDYIRVTVGTMMENSRFIEELKTVVKENE
ncbi:MAG: histidinol-phosphate transaminase [Deltaproteobacteria bacterium RIFCSPLOWO2_12_FULL_60_19]|nr:MAG: histidinol-phosphate transaminase [Deltaproteobacteria bacterium RIFCSPLOWO2_12_FULL_60_19]